LVVGRGAKLEDDSGDAGRFGLTVGTELGGSLAIRTGIALGVSLGVSLGMSLGNPLGLELGPSLDSAAGIVVVVGLGVVAAVMGASLDDAGGNWLV
jgi:hypothetical protein